MTLDPKYRCECGSMTQTYFSTCLASEWGLQLACVHSTETHELRTGQSSFKSELIVPGWKCAS